MTRVAVYHESADPESMPHRAVSGRNQAMGRTAGEALDALAAQLPQEDADTLVIVRNMSPDRFFSAEQRRRLEELMALRREAIAGNSLLTAQQEAELEQLVDAEVRAATERAANRPELQVVPAPVRQDGRVARRRVVPFPMRAVAGPRHFSAPQGGGLSRHLAIPHGTATTISTRTASVGDAWVRQGGRDFPCSW